MNAIAFLLMLAVFGAVAYWYILNLETGSDGEEGIMGLKPDIDTPVGAMQQRLESERRGGYRTALKRIRERSGKGPEADREKLEREMKAELAELEDNRKHFPDPRTGAVRAHVGVTERQKPRTPYRPERGTVVDPAENQSGLRERLREARLQSDNAGKSGRRPSADRPRRYRLKDDKPPRH